MPRATVNMFVYHVKPVQDHPRRELQRKMHIEVFEELKRTRIAMQSCPQPKSTRITTKRAHRRVEEVEEPETRRITKPNPGPTTAATRKYENCHAK